MAARSFRVGDLLASAGPTVLKQTTDRSEAQSSRRTGRHDGRRIRVTDDGLRVLALWTFHTWVFEAAETTPYISIRSPERESGKTRVIEVVSLVIRSSEQVAEASISALFRSIDKFHSTLLFDEVDGIFRGRDEDSKDLKRLLTSGYSTGATVLRTVGEQRDPSATGKGRQLSDVIHAKG